MYFADMLHRVENPMYIKTAQETVLFDTNIKIVLLTQLAVNGTGSMTKYGQDGTRCKDL